MKKLLLAAALTALAAPAYAQTCTTDPATGNTLCDPSTLHVSSSTATGKDPVLLNDTQRLSHHRSSAIRHQRPDPRRTSSSRWAGFPTTTGATGIGPLWGVHHRRNRTRPCAARRSISLTVCSTARCLALSPPVRTSASSSASALRPLSFTNFINEYTALGPDLPLAQRIPDRGRRPFTRAAAAASPATRTSSP